MIRTGLAWITILAGLWWTLFPQTLKRMMTRKANWMFFTLALGMVLWPSLHQFGSHGIWGVAGVMLLFAGVVFVARGIVGKLFGSVPLVVYQAIGIINLIGGTLILRRLI
ncbi:MAG: hypothetical protein KBD07_06300 [Candidatus Omnitrophica bacterium]|nr:hypothetical protein [Candidatus Omnitrophota bacterium]